MKRTKKIIAVLLSMTLALGLLAGCGGGADREDTVIVVEGNFAESTIGAYLAKELILAHTDLKVEAHDAMSTVPIANAIRAKDVDLGLGYDGTLLATIMQGDPSEVPEGEDLFTYVNEKAADEVDMMLTSKLGFQNTYALAVKEEFAEANNLENISDLQALAPDLIFGAEHEFFDEEGSVRYNPLNRAYGLAWKDGISLDMGLKYSAIDNGNIDVVLVYSTDGLNIKSGLKVLNDDQVFFPEYHGAFMVRDTFYEEYAEKAPNLEEVLLMLEGQISDDDMTQLNYKVDAEGADPNQVAKDFLEERGLL